MVGLLKGGYDPADSVVRRRIERVLATLEAGGEQAAA
jgi:hypothetical protein